MEYLAGICVPVPVPVCSCVCACTCAPVPAPVSVLACVCRCIAPRMCPSVDRAARPPACLSSCAVPDDISSSFALEIIKGVNE